MGTSMHAETAHAREAVPAASSAAPQGSSKAECPGLVDWTRVELCCESRAGTYRNTTFGAVCLSFSPYLLLNK